MRKGVLLVMGLLFMTTMILAEEACDLEVSVLNQDPYPAVPGEKLEVVFAISNIDSSECGEIIFEILEEFPFTVAKSFKKVYNIHSGTFSKDYNTNKIIPIDFSVNENANDGDNLLEIRYKSSGSTSSSYISKTFDINVEDVRADFEVFVSDYNYETKEIKFEILNIGKSDIEAVTIEIPNQAGVKVTGQNRENVGDLSSNEDTSAEFKVDMNSGEIQLVISYSDPIQVRRSVEKTVDFNAHLFESTKETSENNNWKWAAIAIVVVLVLYLVLRRKKKKK